MFKDLYFCFVNVIFDNNRLWLCLAVDNKTASVVRDNIKVNTHKSFHNQNLLPF